MNNIKREGECCFCFGKEDLFSLLEPYDFEENVVIYSTTIAECFQIELNSYIEDHNRNLYVLCKNCMFRLNDAVMLRSQIQNAYDRLQAECCMKKGKGDDNSNKYSDIVETKEHILKLDNTDVDSKPSLSTDVFKLIHVKGDLEKNDYNTIKNVSDGVKSQPSTSSHFNPSKWTCKCCNKSFKQKKILFHHERIHSDFKFNCNYCNKEFTYKGNLKEHILLHMNIKNIKCDSCNKFYASKTSLLKHKKKYHIDRLSCTICEKTFYTKNTFANHVLSHSDAENRKREMCEENFTTDDSLSKHTWTCKCCNKSFAQKQSLVYHELIHSNIKKNVCDYCKKEFLRKHNLKEHILLHMNIKNIKCDSCGKFYASKTSLSKHKKKYHTNRLSCNICNKTFYSKHTFENHVLSHSDAKTKSVKYAK